MKNLSVTLCAAALAIPPAVVRAASRKASLRSPGGTPRKDADRRYDPHGARALHGDIFRRKGAKLTLPVTLGK